MSTSTMTGTGPYLSPAEAARRLGVSAKALRIYETRGLLKPHRTEVGWRAYGPAEMARAADIVTLRTLGLSLAQAGRVLDGDAAALATALTAHLGVLEAETHRLAERIEAVRRAIAGIERGAVPEIRTLAALVRPERRPALAFDLPWPWGGERFELPETRALTYITGPLFSGKTRLAYRIAETLPGAAFVGLDRMKAVLETPDEGARSVVDRLVGDGATASDALTALVAALEADGPSALVIDMVEQDLDEATQEVLVEYLRDRGPAARPLFLLTRSTAILDLDGVGPDETILFCPANHSPAFVVAPVPGARGYEAVASCLASPEVRARSEGVVAVRTSDWPAGPASRAASSTAAAAP